jgi:hypothetical protein
MKRTISSVVTPYAPLEFHDVSEERTASVLRVDDYGKQARSKKLCGSSSEISANLYKTIRRHIPENGALHSHSSVNLKANYSISSISYIIIIIIIIISSSSSKCKKVMLYL